MPKLVAIVVRAAATRAVKQFFQWTPPKKTESISFGKRTHLSLTKRTKTKTVLLFLKQEKKNTQPPNILIILSQV